MGRRLHADPDLLLQQETRRLVFAAICGEPGANATHLARKLRISPSVVIWHGDKLERAKLIHLHQREKHRIYWPADSQHPCTSEYLRFREQTVMTRKTTESPMKRAFPPLALAVVLLLSGCMGTTPGSTGVAGQPASTFQHIHAVAVDPADSSKLWVATHRGVMTGNNDGDWRYAGDDVSDYMGFSLHPTETGVAYSSGHPTTGGNQGVRKSTDGSKTWTTIALPGQVDCHAMTVALADPNLMYCSSSTGGIYRSSNGKDFSKLTATGLVAPIFTLATPPNQSDTVFAGTPSGILRSLDRGDTWAPFYGQAGLPVASLGFAPGNASIAYAYFAGNTPGLHRSVDSGLTWQKADGGLSANFQAFSLSVDPRDTQTVYAAGGTTIAKSQDGGASWRIVREGP